MSTIEEKPIVCWMGPGCVHYCRLLATVEDGKLTKLRGNKDFPEANCGCADKMPFHTKWLYAKEQLKKPLKRIGERGENKWEEISWEQALDEIAEKLGELRDKYGPETLAVTEGTYRSDMYPIRTRFLNLFGNPSNIGCAGVICYCNTLALNLALIGCPQGWPKMDIAKCIVISGCDVSQSAPLDWAKIKKRREAGETKVIIIDPRKTHMNDDADMWLQLRPGTDTALLMGWLHIIIKEKLYNEAFTKEWIHGFDELCERVKEYTPEKVSEITWVPVDQIIGSARIYAQNWPAVIKFGSATDMFGRNSTRVEHARVALRAITGNLAIGGGETPEGPGPVINGKMIIRDSDLQLADKLPPEQRKKQIGSDRFKLMTWPAFEHMNKYYMETYGIPFPMSAHSFLSVQPLIWKAILEEDPYPIKANITWGSNVLLNGGDVKTVYKALKSPNLELHVVLEHFMTPTAMLADYVLPVASKLEKPMFHTFEDFAPNVMCAQRAVEPLGERRGDFDFWRGLALRFGFGEYFPWETEEELAGYRLAPIGKTFEEVALGPIVVNSDEPWTYERIHPKTGKKTGFATSTGKIELYSETLKALGYDPLPYYEEPPESPVSTPELTAEYPYILITGGNFRPMYHSENRHPGLGTREQYPKPIMDINRDTAAQIGVSDGDWVYVETKRGVIRQKALVSDNIAPGVINVQSHWWFPELPPREPWLYGMWESNANVLTMGQDPDTFDELTGGWPLRALLCKVYKVEEVIRTKRIPPAPGLKS